MDEAARRVAQTAIAEARVDDRVLAVLLPCERGHLALAEGRSGRMDLEQACEAAGALRTAPQTEIGAAFGRLERAQATFDAARSPQLFRGERIDDLPEGLRRWLVRSEQLAAGEAFPAGAA